MSPYDPQVVKTTRAKLVSIPALVRQYRRDRGSSLTRSCRKPQDASRESCAANEEVQEVCRRSACRKRGTAGMAQETVELAIHAQRDRNTEQCRQKPEWRQRRTRQQNRRQTSQSHTEAIRIADVQCIGHAPLLEDEHRPRNPS